MKKRLINLFLFASSFIGYLEWGNNNKMFLFQAEAEIIQKAFQETGSVLHPLIVLPLFGQILLLVSVFQKIPGRLVTLTGFACLASIMIMLLIVGMLSINIKIFASTIPFIIAGILVIIHYRKPQKGRGAV